MNVMKQSLYFLSPLIIHSCLSAGSEPVLVVRGMHDLDKLPRIYCRYRKERQTSTLTNNLKLPVCLTDLSLDCRRKVSGIHAEHANSEFVDMIRNR